MSTPPSPGEGPEESKDGRKPRGPEAVHQPGIIFSALGSKISSEELLKRMGQEDSRLK